MSERRSRYVRKYIYADESGDFKFSNHHRVSRYFILTTVLIDDHNIELAMLDLRRELVWNGTKLPREFHATEDSQLVRDKVFEVLNRYDFRIDATVLNKRKAYPGIRNSEEQFYRYACFYHMKYVAPRVASTDDELLVIAASIGTRRKLDDFRAAVEGVLKLTSPTQAVQIDAWPAAVDPCLQVADYCCWAIQRKWERGDCRSYDLIKDKIRSEYDLFARGTRSYY